MYINYYDCIFTGIEDKQITCFIPCVVSMALIEFGTET